MLKEGFQVVTIHKDGKITGSIGCSGESTSYAALGKNGAENLIKDLIEKDGFKPNDDWHFEIKSIGEVKFVTDN